MEGYLHASGTSADWGPCFAESAPGQAGRKAHKHTNIHNYPPFPTISNACCPSPDLVDLNPSHSFFIMSDDQVLARVWPILNRSSFVRAAPF